MELNGDGRHGQPMGTRIVPGPVWSWSRLGPSSLVHGPWSLLNLWKTSSFIENPQFHGKPTYGGTRARDQGPGPETRDRLVFLQMDPEGFHPFVSTRFPIWLGSIRFQRVLANAICRESLEMVWCPSPSSHVDRWMDDLFMSVSFF